jgi:prepilin-type N-terminal cleavage/methylation domain-containing protein
MQGASPFHSVLLAGAPPCATRTVARQAFTLIEILVVIVILGVLATLVAPNVFSKRRHSEGRNRALADRDARRRSGRILPR